MILKSYTAKDLFDSLTVQEDMLVLDVRNQNEFDFFSIEGPYKIDVLNLPYFNFIEQEDISLSKVPRDKPIKILCSKEGSSQFVGEILINNGYKDVSFLSGGINKWGNLLIPKKVNPVSDSYSLYQFIRPGKASCNYGIIYNNEMAVFDPSINIEFYTSFAASKGAKIVRIFETHLQADYLSGSKRISDQTGSEIFAHKGDFKYALFEYKCINDNDVYHIGENGPEIRVFHSPGHTPGSTSYIVDENYLISGDTVFILSIGRPDLGSKTKEWSVMLYDTLINKINFLDKNLHVLPGHFMDWKEANSDFIFSEKLEKIIKNNAHLYNMDSPEKFIQYIMDNMSKTPAVYDEIRKINIGLQDLEIEKSDILDLGKNECSVESFSVNKN